MQETSSGKQNIVILVLLRFCCLRHHKREFSDIVPGIDLNKQQEGLLHIKMMPYNKLLTNFTCSEPYWGILALGRFCTDLTALSPYCHDLRPISPVRPSHSVSKRLEIYNTFLEREIHYW